MSRRDVVVIGGSAGGLQALQEIASRLPASLEACVLVVIHTAASSPGLLPGIVAAMGPLPAAFARPGDRLTPGRILIAPPDCHLIVTPIGLDVVRGPRENGFRPAIDPLFRTAGRQLRRRVVGVVLSGALSDGTFGLSVIKQLGGVTIVQDPDDAVIPSIPASAIGSLDVDYILPASRIAEAVVRLSRASGGAAKGAAMVSARNGPEPQRPSEQTDVADMNSLFGGPTGLTCPDCGGALWEVENGRAVRYQCHVGHQYAPENLEAGQRDSLDQALWSAVRVLEEQAELKARMAARATKGRLTHVAKAFETSARDARNQALYLRQVLFNLDENAPPRATTKRRATRRRNGAQSRR